MRAYIRDFKWLILIFIVVAAWMVWNNVQGDLAFLGTQQETWAPNGIRGYHK